MHLSGQHIAVVMPSYDGRVPASTAGSLIELSHALASCGARMSFFVQPATAYVDLARNLLLARVMLDADCTGALHLDSDIGFQVDDAVKLIAASGLYDITCGLYRAKTDEEIFFVKTAGPVDEYGVMPCDRVPFGFVYTTRRVLQSLWDAHADREFVYGETTARLVFECGFSDGRVIGEDSMFCAKAKAAGFRIGAIVDIELEHYGTKAFTGAYANRAKNE